MSAMMLDKFSVIPDDLQQYLAEVRADAPERFIDLDVRMDNLRDRLELRTAFVLLTRGEMDRAESMGRVGQLIGARIRKAVGISEDASQQAKRLRMERRQLLARGKEAASRKAKAV